MRPRRWHGAPLRGERAAVPVKSGEWGLAVCCAIGGLGAVTVVVTCVHMVVLCTYMTLRSFQGKASQIPQTLSTESGSVGNAERFGSFKDLKMSTVSLSPQFYLL